VIGEVFVAHGHFGVGALLEDIQLSGKFTRFSLQLREVVLCLWHLLSFRPIILEIVGGAWCLQTIVGVLLIHFEESVEGVFGFIVERECICFLFSDELYFVFESFVIIFLLPAIIGQMIMFPHFPDGFR